MGNPRIEECWKQYKRDRDQSAREELISEYAYLVKYVAGRLNLGFRHRVEMDDLASYGIFGLLDAIEKFDPSRGIKFETYAVVRIRGSILDGLRSMDWVPQSVRNKSRELERTYARLEHQLGRSVTDQEVAEAMNLSREEFDQLLQEVSYTTITYLEDIWAGDQNGGDAVRILDTIEDTRVEDPLNNLAREEARAMLAAAIDKLPERERLVISLYYYESLTLKEIGAVLGLSESRISQLHTKAVLRLRGRLGRQKKKLMETG
ncbi:MAG: RNA polymerase sigma factor WhiG [Syntrophomonadaceae bacterium]|nr:RNA polymerase sigma factor WhiG [Syntrophomonadaceae bacterium]